MDLTGQLSNLPALVESLLATPVVRAGGRVRIREERRAPILRQHRYELIRDALVRELGDHGAELRLMDLRERVELRLGESVDRRRFRDYVNDQSRGASPLLERLGYGTYRLRR